MDARRFRTLFSISLAIMDAAMVGLAFLVAHTLRKRIPWPEDALDMEPFSGYGGVLVIFIGSLLLVFFLLRLYHLPRASSRVDEFYGIVVGATLGVLLSVALSALLLKNSVFEVNLPRVMILYAWLASLVLVTTGRWVLELLRDAMRSRGLAPDRVLLIGTGATARLILLNIKGSPFLGYHVVGVVKGRGPVDEVEGVPVIGHVDDLPRLMEAERVDEVIICLPNAPGEEILHLISLVQSERVSIKIVPDVYDLMTAGVTIDDLGGLPLLSIRDVALRGWKLSLKRAMDVVGSAIGLVLLSPLMMLVALLIKLDSKGPVLFVQERMGLDAKPFPILKFRSMRTDAEANGPGWTVEGDPRVTRLGRFIRRTSVDELPQFINVLLGDMSLVGPRPEQPAFVEQFRKRVPRYMERHLEKAGITGWAQVNGLRGDTSIEERTKYDLWYTENWSIWLDIKIVIRTVLRVFFDRSAY
jgi:exopolysaccharide biosynthesis polyprenyl glycosylphosphotransferase